MKKVFELLRKEKPVDGDVGIEIEAEGRNMQEVDTKFWKTEDDGSLRGRFPESRAEFVLKRPISLKDVPAALQNLQAALPEAKFDFSFRTSVHVHINVQDMTEVEVMNFIYLYLLLEEPLVNFCGRERKGNRFCLRLVDAEGMLKHISRTFSDGLRYAMALDGNAVRYSAINLASLKKYGSLEFRAMRGNLEQETLNVWADTLCTLRDKAKKYGCPKDILKEFQELEPKDFMKTVLAHNYENFTYPRMVREMQRSFSLSLDLPYAYKEQQEAIKNKDEPDFEWLYQRPDLHITGHKKVGKDIFIQINNNAFWHAYPGAHENAQKYFRDLEAAQPAAPVRPKPIRKPVNLDDF